MELNLKTTVLSSEHYAAAWPIDDIYPLEETNALGLRYALLAEGEEKQQALLDLCRRFHPHLMKYLFLICRGHVSKWEGKVNKDLKRFLRYFLPRGARASAANLGKAARHLHLSFKGMETEEIYDVLMEQFLRAAAKYDPHYVEKLQRVVEEVKRALRQFGGFRSADLNRHLEFDGSRYLRLLCRRGFLFSERKAAEGKTV